MYFMGGMLPSRDVHLVTTDALKPEGSDPYWLAVGNEGWEKSRSSSTLAPGTERVKEGWKRFLDVCKQHANKKLVRDFLLAPTHSTHLCLSAE